MTLGEKRRHGVDLVVAGLDQRVVVGVQLVERVSQLRVRSRVVGGEAANVVAGKGRGRLHDGARNSAKPKILLTDFFGRISPGENENCLEMGVGNDSAMFVLFLGVRK